MAELQIGMVGLGVMGTNLSLNMAEHGFSVAGYDAWPEPVDKFVAKAAGEKLAAKVEGFKSLPEFVKSIRKPRRIVMLVKAGEVVDKTIASLLPLLEPGDMLVDAGNEFYPNTERRFRELQPKGIRYFGMGVSGGEEGARHGPSMMPGGDKAGYQEWEPMLTKIAAQADSGPCVTYVGPGGSGHYVKMVHNGIEYGDMQLISEAYDLLRSAVGLSNDEIAETFADWNKGELQSFLIEITSKIFQKKDPDSDARLIDVIVDAASSKGTGKWTVQEAAEIGAPCSVIAAALEARYVSSDRAGRKKASEVLSFGGSPATAPIGGAKRAMVEAIRGALFASKCVSYAQGMNILRAASDKHEWNLNLGELARIWKAGCIIRAQFLGRIKEAYDRDPKLSNLLLDSYFRDELMKRQLDWRKIVSRAFDSGVPVPAMSAALSYYDSIRRARLPANLIQAQRDYFGAHTYERLDKPGTFHTEWTKE